MIQPFGQNAWLRASIPLQYFKGKDQRGMDLASTNNRRTNSFWMGVWGPFGQLENVEALSVAMGDAIKKYDANHLNLGIRFGGTPAPAVIRMGKAFDVCSINVYEYEPTKQLKALYEATGRPLLIGEFHLGVPADGLGAGLVQTAGQTERAKGYRYYMEQAAARPGFRPPDLPDAGSALPQRRGPPHDRLYGPGVPNARYYLGTR